VTNAGPTVVTGDLGVYPAGSVIGFPPGTVTGTIYAADLTAQNAQAANLTAYGFLAAETCTTPFTGATDLAGMTLVPGVYCFDSSASNSGLLQLDAQGDPTAVWVFQTVSTLITATGSHVVVINGGPTQACNVFWQVGTSATLFSGSTFVGNILAHTSITLQTAASLFGRAWAYTGEVTLDSNTVGGCSPNGAPNSITIVKNTVGGNDTFPFTASGVGVSGFSILTTGNPGSGSHSFTGLSAGTYTFQETPIPAGWSLTDLACVDPSNDSTVTLATGTASVNLAAGEAVTCTYTDTFTNVGQGSITIVKNTVGGNGGTFPFTASGAGVSGFSIITTGNPGSSSHSFTGLSAGTYTFQETPIPAGWSLTGLACVDPTNDSTVTLATGTASVSLAAGETVTCTYTDTFTSVGQGSITIVKNTVGGNDTFPFAASGVGVSGFSILTTGNPGSGSHLFTGLSAGTYTFQETPIPASWSLTGLACVDPTNDSTVTLATGTASVSLAAGEAVTCTYTDNLLPPPVANAPTLSEWAMILLAALLAIVGFVVMRRPAR
jgi:hypothetical protein